VPMSDASDCSGLWIVTCAGTGSAPVCDERLTQSHGRAQRSALGPVMYALA
jgi:hypothetical protein